MTERTPKPGERIQYACEHWYEAGSYGVRLYHDIPNKRYPACQRTFEERAIAEYGNDRLSAAREGVVKALEGLITDATEMAWDLDAEFSRAPQGTDKWEPDSLPAARAALRELEEASK